MSIASGYRSFVFEQRWSVPLTAVLILGFFATLYLATDIMSAGLEVYSIDNRLQLVGLLALFAILPTWLMSCFIVTQRHSLSMARQLERHLPAEFALAEGVRQFPVRKVLLGLAASLVYALAFNVPTRQFGGVLSGDGAVITIFLGQVLVWVSVGFLLAIRLHVVEMFSNAGKLIEISIFEQSNLRPFARIGMLDVVIIVGSMAIATVQSLDAEFRLENYLTAMLVAIPAAAALLLRPMWSLHSRLEARKQTMLAEVNARIARAPDTSDDDDMRSLEALLQRRDRIQSVHTWPFDIGIWSRLVFYVLIPPLAWAGAALMEVAISRWLGA